MLNKDATGKSGLGPELYSVFQHVDQWSLGSPCKWLRILYTVDQMLPVFSTHGSNFVGCQVMWLCATSRSFTRTLQCSIYNLRRPCLLRLLSWCCSKLPRGDLRSKETMWEQSQRNCSVYIWQQTSTNHETWTLPVVVVTEWPSDLDASSIHEPEEPWRGSTQGESGANKLLSQGLWTMSL